MRKIRHEVTRKNRKADAPRITRMSRIGERSPRRHSLLVSAGSRKRVQIIRCATAPIALSGGPWVALSVLSA